MRILVLGGEGMLGHKIVQRLASEHSETWWTVRSPKAALPLALPRSERCLDCIDVTEWPPLEAVLRRMRPDVVVNCIGVIKQRAEAHNPILSITINALLPHRIAETVAGWAGRLIHFSSDCVFSGRKGHYSEADPSDAEDLYGRTKFLGEAAGRNALTLRTSIIGRELENHQSLLDWFLLSGHSQVRGFTNVWWSGVTTNHLAEVVADLIHRHPSLSGLYQVSSGRISKHELLCRLRDGYGFQVEVQPDEGPVNDRSLDGSRFAAATGYRCPPWEQLIRELISDPTPYPSRRPPGS
jgi:dTDP-4-dehydrorhamnose reductase